MWIYFIHLFLFSLFLYFRPRGSIAHTTHTHTHIRADTQNCKYNYYMQVLKSQLAKDSILKHSFFIVVKSKPFLEQKTEKRKL